MPENRNNVQYNKENNVIEELYHNKFDTKEEKQENNTILQKRSWRCNKFTRVKKRRNSTKCK